MPASVRVDSEKQIKLVRVNFDGTIKISCFESTVKDEFV